MFYIYSIALFVASSAYLYIFMSMPIAALYYNGYYFIAILIFTFFAFFSLFFAIAIPISLYRRLFVNKQMTNENPDTATPISTAIFFSFIVYFGDLYPQIDSELDTPGYQKVLEMISESETTLSVYHNLVADGILTVRDLDVLVDTFAIYEEKRAGLRKIRQEEAAVFEKEAAKRALLDSYPILGDTNSSLTEEVCSMSGNLKEEVN